MAVRHYSHLNNPTQTDFYIIIYTGFKWGVYRALKILSRQCIIKMIRFSCGGDVMPVNKEITFYIYRDKWYGWESVFVGSKWWFCLCLCENTDSWFELLPELCE